MSTKLRMMGLALIVVCAFGVASTGGAQAALPEFTAQGLGAGVKAPLASTTTVTPAGGDYSFTVSGFFRITCTSVELDEGFVVNTTDEGAIKSLTFFGCTVKTPTGGSTTCKIKGGTPSKNGEIHTNAIKLTLVTGPAGQHWVTFSPDAGVQEFVEFSITECSLEGKNKLKGAFVTEVTSPASGVFATGQELSSNDAITAATGDQLLFGLRSMVLDATFDIHLGSDALWTVDW